ncbi:oxidative stress-responsive serine-rich protein 1 [Lates japonicus]|uniref:Oxidative stress-responsive serine-rich protein 1 n=1 Tax=Lates japonicus TaxID=270547 RepID=A0AAD3RGK4_LATJO|nr:oxidative stress-responsive serine-rich protein 1 [Lates japonicus]
MQLGGWSERPPPTMEAGGKDCEEETLQTAFKKLRVDAESVPGAVSVSEALAPRVASRPCLDASGAKPKLSCPKDNWHGCMRKTSRGASRTQRRRRSKSPILHPPKFTYCSAAAASALSAPSGCLKQQRLAVPEPVEPRPAVDGRTAPSAALPAQNKLSSSGTPGHISPLVFGSCAAGYETHIGAVVSSLPLKELPGAITTVVASTRQDGGSSGDVRPSEEEKSACDGAESGAGAPLRSGPVEAADFGALSKLQCSADGPHTSCSCTQRSSSDSQEESQQAAECQCQSHRRGWHGVEVYSFTGLRNVISECERSLPSHDDAPRTLSTNSNAAAASSSSPSSSSSGSPRSCSEQARGYVDDITIEDLSGYMEYYLYIPKKMSHMAEMMYT